MAKVKALTDRSIAERFADVKDEEHVWGDISEETRALATRIREHSLEEELTARLHAARNRCPEMRAWWRNGRSPRRIFSRWGILDIRLPRARQRLPASEVLGRFQRREATVDAPIRDAFRRRVSTRDVGAVLEPVLGWRASAQPVSRVARALPRAAAGR